MVVPFEQREPSMSWTICSTFAMKSGEAHLHNIEFFPIDDLPVGWHNTVAFPTTVAL